MAACHPEVLGVKTCAGRPIPKQSGLSGLFDVCRVNGLTGRQGVIIPVENIEDLMLREDVVETVAAGKFHILPVATVEEGIEVLTGVKAGQRDSTGKFEPGTVFALVDQRLRQMAETLKE